jgi:deoxycytidylate deaminase
LIYCGLCTAICFSKCPYIQEDARVDSLSRLFSHSASVFNSNDYRDKAERIVQIDDNELSNIHGQRVAKIFHDADFIINTDAERSVEDQVFRFCELLFGSNKLSPTRLEYGMYLAKAAALRTLDLSRQVGAAIFSPSGEVVTLGSNEVPKAGGGSYWCDESYDDRDYARGYDPNDQRKRENLFALLRTIGKTEQEAEKLLSEDAVRDSQIMEALEYGRVVHAEMSALTDAARLGVSVKGATIYCTTFPCHMCAKHIIAAGLSKVVFLEPYPKSLASDLHADAILGESGERGKYQNYPSVKFEHFFGISPRRYRELFERGSRKINGEFVEYISGVKRPIIDFNVPAYQQTEAFIIERSTDIITQTINDINETAS